MAILFVGIDLAKNVFALHGVGATVTLYSGAAKLTAETAANAPAYRRAPRRPPRSERRAQQTAAPPSH